MGDRRALLSESPILHSPRPLRRSASAEAAAVTAMGGTPPRGAVAMGSSPPGSFGGGEGLAETSALHGDQGCTCAWGSGLHLCMGIRAARVHAWQPAPRASLSLPRQHLRFERDSNSNSNQRPAQRLAPAPHADEWLSFMEASVAPRSKSKARRSKAAAGQNASFHDLHRLRLPLPTAAHPLVSMLLHPYPYPDPNPYSRPFLEPYSMHTLRDSPSPTHASMRPRHTCVRGTLITSRLFMHGIEGHACAPVSRHSLPTIQTRIKCAQAGIWLGYITDIFRMGPALGPDDVFNFNPHPEALYALLLEYEFRGRVATIRATQVRGAPGAHAVGAQGAHAVGAQGLMRWGTTAL